MKYARILFTFGASILSGATAQAAGSGLVTIGSNISVSVVQNGGLVNGSVIGQIGDANAAHVQQSGVVNGSVIGQTGAGDHAVVLQTGHANGSGIAQGF